MPFPETKRGDAEKMDGVTSRHETFDVQATDVREGHSPVHSRDRYAPRDCWQESKEVPLEADYARVQRPIELIKACLAA
jgi:hypothetical protein